MDRYEEDGFIFGINNKEATLFGIRHDDNKLQDEKIIIPHAVKGLPVKNIGTHAFAGLKIQSVEIPDTVKMIYSAAFKGCDRLERVLGYKAPPINGKTHSSEWLMVSDCAFKNCRSLTDVVIGREISCLGIEAFANCLNLSRCVASLKKIRKDAFHNCAFLKDIVLSENAYLYGSSIEKSGINLINIWGDTSMTKATINHIVKNGIELCCDPESNIVDLAYMGANITFLF